MDCSTPGFPVLHRSPEFAQTHADWVDDAIQPIQVGWSRKERLASGNKSVLKDKILEIWLREWKLFLWSAFSFTASQFSWGWRNHRQRCLPSKGQEFRKLSLPRSLTWSHCLWGGGSGSQGKGLSQESLVTQVGSFWGARPREPGTSSFLFWNPGQFQFT